MTVRSLSQTGYSMGDAAETISTCVSTAFSHGSLIVDYLRRQSSLTLGNFSIAQRLEIAKGISPTCTAGTAHAATSLCVEECNDMPLQSLLEAPEMAQWLAHVQSLSVLWHVGPRTATLLFSH